jgi:tetratricopeptide (TPR) repeat protein
VPPLCETAVRLHPGFGWAEELHARALAALSRPDEALARFDRALAIDPSYLAAHYQKGLLLQRQKRYPEAVATLDQALALAPNNAFVLSVKAECLEEAGRPYEAAQAWQRWLALVPGTHPKVPVVRSTPPRLNVAEFLDRLGRHEEAAKAYQQFLGVASPVLLAGQAQCARARLHEIRGGSR